MLEVREIEALEMRKELVPQVVLDAAGSADDDAAHEEPEHSRYGSQAENRHRIEAHLGRVNTDCEVVHCELQQPRTGHSDRGCRGTAQQPECELAVIPPHVTQQPAARGHPLSIWLLFQRHGFHALKVLLVSIWNSALRS